MATTTTTRIPRLPKPWSRQHPLQPGLFWLAMWNYTINLWIDPVLVEVVEFAGKLNTKVLYFSPVLNKNVHPRVNLGSEYDLSKTPGCAWSKVESAPPTVIML